jgi:hypothetical protein
LYGDNQSVITSATIPASTLNKRHNALSYHRVRECIAMGIIYFMHVSGTKNPSDILTKFLGYTKLRPLVQPLLFWKGETMLIDKTIPVPYLIDYLHHTLTSGLRGVTDMNNPSVPENLLIPDTFDSTNTNMGNFSNTTSAISPINTEAIQSTVATENTTTNSNQAELDMINTVMANINNQVK